MPGIRIAAAGACILLLSGLTIVGAAAQTAASSTATPGKPLQLLKIFQQSSKAKREGRGQIFRQKSGQDRCRKENPHPYRRGATTTAARAGTGSKRAAV
jgi:hypothetical protein